MSRRYKAFALLTILGVVLTACEAPNAAPTPSPATSGNTGNVKAFNMCVVHNNADHPSITAITSGMKAMAPMRELCPAASPIIM